MKLHVKKTKSSKSFAIVFDVPMPGQYKKLSDMGYGDGQTPLHQETMAIVLKNKQFAHDLCTAYNKVFGEEKNCRKCRYYMAIGGESDYFCCYLLGRGCKDYKISMKYVDKVCLAFEEKKYGD